MPNDPCLLSASSKFEKVGTPFEKVGIVWMWPWKGGYREGWKGGTHLFTTNLGTCPGKYCTPVMCARFVCALLGFRTREFPAKSLTEGCMYLNIYVPCQLQHQRSILYLYFAMKKWSLISPRGKISDSRTSTVIRLLHTSTTSVRLYRLLIQWTNWA